MPNRPIIGVTHQLLCPDAWLDAEAHERTLLEIVLPSPVGGVDLLPPPDFDAARVAREAAALRDSGKRVVFCLPFLFGDEQSPSSPDPAWRRRSLELARRALDVGRAFGAAQVVTVSGPDPGPEHRPSATAAYAEFLVELCAEAAPLPVCIEPMDRTIDKQMLIGPTVEAAALVDAVHAAGGTNLGLLIDMSHLPLLGEGFAEALTAAGRRTQHVHLGNCLLSDPASVWYGDKHPPLGLPGSEHDVGDLADFWSALTACGYLDRPAPSVSFEMRPRPGLGEQATLAEHLAWLEELLP